MSDFSNEVRMGYHYVRPEMMCVISSGAEKPSKFEVVFDALRNAAIGVVIFALVASFLVWPPSSSREANSFWENFAIGAASGYVGASVGMSGYRGR